MCTHVYICTQKGKSQVVRGTTEQVTITYLHTNIYECIHTCIYMRIYICTYIYMYINTFIYKCTQKGKSQAVRGIAACASGFSGHPPHRLTQAVCAWAGTSDSSKHYLLHHVVVCCSVLQGVIRRRSVLQCVAMCCSGSSKHHLRIKCQRLVCFLHV